MRDKAIEELKNKKLCHSKVMNLQHKKLEMQNYLKPSGLRIKQEEAQEIFKMRSKVSDVKLILEETMRALNLTSASKKMNLNNM